MHPADIKAALTKAGSSQSDVARNLPHRYVSASAVWAVIDGRSTSATIAGRISEITGITVQRMWPGKYPALEAEQRSRARKARRGRP